VAGRQAALQRYVDVILKNQLIRSDLAVRRFFDPKNYSQNFQGWCQGDLGPIFRTFFVGKIPQKIFPSKMLEKIGIFCGKCFKKLYFQQIPRNFPGKITFR
jgi:hypothetical protein